MSSGRSGDGLVEDCEQLAGDVALQAADDLLGGLAFLETPCHGVLGRAVALAWRSPPRLRQCRRVLPEDAWIGEDPHSIAKQASERSRPGLSPAATSSAPAESGPTPNRATSPGAALAVSRFSSVSSVATSACRA